MLPVGLYFHIPFCSKKCPYCHFYVLPNEDPLKLLLLEGLYAEWLMQSPKLKGKKIGSIYFGGGTPSLFGPEAIRTILNWIDPKENQEITLEANPEDITPDLLKAYLDVGISRLSIGIQSLDDSSLNILERGHSAKKALKAINSAHQVGFSNISIDLMYDLPFQSLSSWEATLKAVKDLPITHLSLYNLTFEPHTLFFKRKKELSPHLPDPEKSLMMLQNAIQILEEIGLKRYEISAFAKPGFEAVHNSGYWTGRPFLGFGPSAFSYWEGARFKNISHLHRYHQKVTQNQSAIDFTEKLPYPNDLHELLAVRLRLFEAIPFTQIPPTAHSIIHALTEKGWLILHNNSLSLSPEGRLFYDSVAEAIIT